MIEFKSLSQKIPYLLFKEKYDEALEKNQKNIEALCISTFNKLDNEVDSRFVNLKFIDKDNFIFFSNYNSSKAFAIESHNQISGLFFWSSINTQIRVRAKIKKTSNEFNQEYFFNRSKEKNALAISSNQSSPIDSYTEVLKNYNKALINNDLKKCPEFWGGYSFTPYYFEFWEGHDSRINKRDVYENKDHIWKHLILEP